MANARDLRLQSDYIALRTLAEASNGSLEIEATQGKPPDQYVILFRCRSIEAIVGGMPVYRDLHRLRIKLPARYPLPSAPPQLSMLTPSFNPHVYPNREVCLGNWLSSEYLDQLVLRIGALLQFDRRILNMHDPANEAAMDWVRKNLILLPTDDATFGAPPAVTERPGLMQPVEENPDLEWIDH